MTELRDRDPGELVQPIILRIDKEDPSSEDEGLSAVARAAVIAYLQDPQNPDWQQWASQAFACVSIPDWISEKAVLSSSI